MTTITEQTAIRLAAALERVADMLERGGSLNTAAVTSERATVAELIVGGPDALKAMNKRNRGKRR